jgi:hypothetical protein
MLWKSRPFVWSNDTEEAFQELKRYLTSPPVMVAPEPGEPLLFYIVATSEAVSMVLVTERLDPHGLHELGSSSADGSGFQDPGPAEELPTDQGPKTWDLWMSRELSTGPSPRRPPWAPVTRESWVPRFRAPARCQGLGAP